METERKLSGAHILVVPYPSQGHVNPMLQFCKRLLSKGAKPTLVLTNFISKSFNLRSTSIAVATISDGFDDGGFREARDVDDYLEQMQVAGTRTLTDLVRSYEKSSDRVDCIVYDAFLTWALDVAHGCGVKGAAFFTHACAVNYVYYYAACGALKLPVEAAVELPGLPPLDLPDFPSFISVHGSYPAYFKMVLNEFSNLGRADFVLVNTFYKLEAEVKPIFLKFPLFSMTLLIIVNLSHLIFLFSFKKKSDLNVDEDIYSMCSRN